MSGLKRWFPAFVIMGIIFALSSVRGEVINTTPAGNAPTQMIGHFLLFFTLCLSYYYATGDILVSILLTILYGIFDELHQLNTPLRSASLFDIKTDTLGALTSGVFLLLRRKFMLRKKNGTRADIA